MQANQLARASDPVTSHMAAARVSEFAGSHREQILGVLKRFGPLDPEQLEFYTGIPAYAIRKRLPELQKAKLARPLDIEEAVSYTESGRRQRVWEAV